MSRHFMIIEPTRHLDFSAIQGAATAPPSKPTEPFRKSFDEVKERETSDPSTRSDRSEEEATTPVARQEGDESAADIAPVIVEVDTLILPLEDAPEPNLVLLGPATPGNPVAEVRPEVGSVATVPAVDSMDSALLAEAKGTTASDLAEPLAQAATPSKGTDSPRAEATPVDTKSPGQNSSESAQSAADQVARAAGQKTTRVTDTTTQIHSAVEPESEPTAEKTPRPDFHLLRKESAASSARGELVSGSTQLESESRGVFAALSRFESTNQRDTAQVGAASRVGVNPGTTNSGRVSSLAPNAETAVAPEGRVSSDSRLDSGAPKSSPPLRWDSSDEVAALKRVYRLLRRAVHKGDHSLRVRLDPPSLGRVSVDLEWKDRQLGVHFEVESDEVKGVLSRHLDELKEVLKQYGASSPEVFVNLKEEAGSDQGSESRQPQQQREEIAGLETVVEEEVRVLKGPAHLGSHLDVSR